jgi:V/A-type H+-transporting ATPase subunit E
MAGLETILQKIEGDSSVQCKKIISRAQSEADAIRKQAHKDADRQAAEILSKAETQAVAIVKRAESDAKTVLSRALLAEKVDIIQSVMKQAAGRIKAMPDAEYFQTIKRLVIKHARGEAGIMRISPVDAARLPSGFEASLNEMLTEKGGSLKIEPVQMESGGFILVYGDIEHNCTFEALIESMHEELKDRINRSLFLS